MDAANVESFDNDNRRRQHFCDFNQWISLILIDIVKIIDASYLFSGGKRKQLIFCSYCWPVQRCCCLLLAYWPDYNDYHRKMITLMTIIFDRQRKRFS